jgi:hypothetical protein
MYRKELKALTSRLFANEELVTRKLVDDLLKPKDNTSGFWSVI